jgi:hypothetical protein
MLTPIPIAGEILLEEQITADISILNTRWMIIGQQVRTAFDKYIDLLAIDASGSVIIIELKRNKTPRDVVAQVLDYASWVVNIVDSKLVDLFYDYSKKHQLKEQSLDWAFKSKCGISFDDMTYDGSHQMVIVAAELDASSERIINYLNDTAKIPVNVVFFTDFEDGPINTWVVHGWSHQKKHKNEAFQSHLKSHGMVNFMFLLVMGNIDIGMMPKTTVL